MSISDELQKLETLLHNGTLTQDEFQLAKRRVLEQSPSSVPSGALDDIRAQNDIAQLDREWAMERENYMVVGKYGRRHLPSKAGSVIMGLFIVGFGTFWTIGASSMPHIGEIGVFSFFPLFGVLFVLMGAAMSVYGFMKAVNYEAAHENYQARRRDLLSQRRNSP